MGLGIAAVFVLTDPEVEAVVGHERFDAAVARRAPVIQRQFAVHRVGDQVGATHRQSAYRIGLDIIAGLVEILGAAKAIMKHEGIVEHRAEAVQHVQHVRRRGPSEQQGAAGTAIDDAMQGVHRDRKHRAGLPFEDMLLAVAFLPDLGRAAALDDQEDLLVHVLFDVERARRRHLDDVAAPLALGAVELDEVAAPAHAFPGDERQVLHLADADAAKHRNAFLFHERVVGCRLLAELAEAGFLVACRFVPVTAVLVVRHFLTPVESFLYKEQRSFLWTHATCRKIKSQFAEICRQGNWFRYTECRFKYFRFSRKRD